MHYACVYCQPPDAREMVQVYNEDGQAGLVHEEEREAYLDIVRQRNLGRLREEIKVLEEACAKYAASVPKPIVHLMIDSSMIGWNRRHSDG